MTSITSVNLLAALNSHHLVSPEHLDALALEALPTDVAVLGRALIERGWLTPYQVNELLHGRGGKLLLGSYVLIDLLGEGGMGQVFKARNWKLDRIVALKLIRKDRLTNASAVESARPDIGPVTAFP